MLPHSPQNRLLHSKMLYSNVIPVNPLPALLAGLGSVRVNSNGKQKLCSVLTLLVQIPENHYNDVIMGAVASQMTSLTIVYSTVYSGADQRKQKKPCVTGLRVGNSPGSVNSPHKWPVTQKMFPFDDVIMYCLGQLGKYHWFWCSSSSHRRSPVVIILTVSLAANFIHLSHFSVTEWWEIHMFLYIFPPTRHRESSFVDKFIW